jgi:hypothetical protein
MEGLPDTRRDVGDILFLKDEKSKIRKGSGICRFD